MTGRAPNEVTVAVEVLGDLLKPGERFYRVDKGPPEEARLLGIRMDAYAPPGTYVLVYDGPVDEPVLTDLRGEVQRLRELAGAKPSDISGA